MSYVNTGRQLVGTLRQVAVYPDATRVPTGVTKANDPSDPDYIPFIDDSDSLAACPLPGTTTTTTTTTTSTTTTTTLDPTSGKFGLFAALGMTITSVRNGTSTGVPSILNSVSLSSGSLLVPYSSVNNGTILVDLTGTPGGDIRLRLEVDSTVIDVKTITGPATYTLALGTITTPPSFIKVSIELP